MSVTMQVPLSSTDSRGPRLYVLEMPNGVIKVGRSNNVDQRITAYEGVKRAWISGMVPDVMRAESALIAETARSASSRSRREWFTGVTFEQCVEIAEGINALVASKSDGTDRQTGRRIRQAVKASGLTIATAAELSGMHTLSFHRSLEGKRPWRLDEIRRVSIALDVHPNDLIVFEDDLHDWSVDA